MVKRWVRDLSLGARLTIAGGRDGWVRLVMTAVGVGLGVALLLVAASIPAMLSARHERTSAREEMPNVSAQDARPETLLIANADTEFRGLSIRGRILRAEGDRAPVPPGLTKLPGPGEMAVSPALRRLLTSPEGALLRPRLDHPIVATIADQGLAGANEYAYYLVDSPATTSAQRGDSAGGFLRIDRFGPGSPGDPMDPVLVLLVVIALVVVLLPVMVFIGTAVRFGGERRDRRLAALRLVGADGRAVRRIAAGEVLVAVLLGMAVGVAILFGARPLIAHVTFWEVSVFAGDIRPEPALAVLTMLAVPVAAVGVTLLAMRRVVVEPLSVVRHSTPVRRRLWWRLLLPAVGLLALYPLLGRITGPASSFNEYQVAAGVALLLIGVAALLPWLVEAVVRRIGGGGVGWQLAVRRLQLNSATSARLVNGVAVAVAGTIALQALFTSVDQDFVRETGQDLDRAQVEAIVLDRPREQVTAVFKQTPGVRSVSAIAELTGFDIDGRIRVGDCADLRELAEVDKCAAGDVFLIDGSSWYDSGDVPALPRPGQQVLPQWKVPANARTVKARTDPSGVVFSGVFATPEAIPASLVSDDMVSVFLGVDEGQPDVYEYIRNSAAQLGPLARVSVLASETETGQFKTVRQGLLIGVLATLLLIGASMLLTTLEQLRERKRVLAVLVAFGTPPATLVRSVLYQVAVPMVLGLLLAAVAGAGLGCILVRIVTRPMVLDWGSIAGITGSAAAVILLVTALSMPVLRRLMRPTGLRTE